MLTQDRLKELLHYDMITGNFTWYFRKRGVKKSMLAGGLSVNGRYLRIGVEGERYFAHRLAFLYVEGFFPKGEVDHISGNGLDNKWSNLRVVDHPENMRNIKISRANTSGFTGVCWHKLGKKWSVEIRVDGAKKYLGLFTNFSDAITARENANLSYGYHKNHGLLREFNA